MRELERNDYGWSYGELVDSFEVEEVFSEHDDDYQGDSFYLLKDGNKYGILIFGWGSCSGCDTLESIGSNLKEASVFRDELWESIQWFSSKAEIRKYARLKDFDLEWYSYSGAGRKFIDRLKTFK